MRIISGKYRGKKFMPPADIPARPTTDFAKEALFNILNNYFEFDEIRFLDLFAGTGSLDYELFSRGCKHMVMVDLSPVSVRFMEKMIRELGMEQVARVVRADVLRYLETERNRYELIFAGPPYALESIDQLPDLVLEKNILTDDGLFVLETSPNHNFSDHPALVDVRHYGQTHFWFFQPVKSDSHE